MLVANDAICVAFDVDGTADVINVGCGELVVASTEDVFRVTEGADVVVSAGSVVVTIASDNDLFTMEGVDFVGIIVGGGELVADEDMFKALTVQG